MRAPEETMTKPKTPTRDEMVDYLRAREYVRGLRGGWAELSAGRWCFFPKDGRRRASDDYILEMAYRYATDGRFDS